MILDRACNVPVTKLQSRAQRALIGRVKEKEQLTDHSFTIPNGQSADCIAGGLPGTQEYKL